MEAFAQLRLLSLCKVVWSAEIKDIHIGNKGVNVSLFADNIRVYISELKNSTSKVLQLI